MTPLQIVLFTFGYAVAFAAVIYFTRAPTHRVVGAMAGGLAAGALGLGAMILGQTLGVWWPSLPSTAPVWVLLYAGLSVSMSPLYLITWRIARRFGSRGLALCLLIVGVIGAPRDYLYAAIHPEWMVFGPGVTPIVADAATYVAMVALGHAVMALVSGTSQAPGASDAFPVGTHR